MKYFAPQQPDVASAIALLIKRLANRPNLIQSRHPVDVAVAKLTLLLQQKSIANDSNAIDNKDSF